MSKSYMSRLRLCYSSVQYLAMLSNAMLNVEVREKKCKESVPCQAATGTRVRSGSCSTVVSSDRHMSMYILYESCFDVPSTLDTGTVSGTEGRLIGFPASSTPSYGSCY